MPSGIAGGHFSHINSSAAQAAIMSPMILIAIIFSSISVRMPRL
jgi:hypothetical protein